MRRRPDVEVRMRSAVRPGESLHVELSVASSTETPIDFVEIHIFGTEMLLVRRDQRVQQIRSLLHLVSRVAGEGRLGAETYLYEAIFPIPKDAPPSYLGNRVEHRYWIEVRISIPWWADVRERYDVSVIPAPAARPEDVPSASTSLTGNEAFVEVSLPGQCFAPGDVIEGAIAFGNTGGREARAIDLALVGTERIRADRRDLALEGQRFNAFLPLDGPEEGRTEGREIPFRLAVPKKVVPAFETPASSLAWSLEVRLDLVGGPDVVHRVPIAIGPYDRPAEEGAMRRRVGVGRWHAVWSGIAEGAGLDLDPGALELTGLLHGCEVTVRVGSTEERKPGLVADLRWASWGLDLVIRNASLFGSGIDVGDDVFARRFRVSARSAEQARGALDPALREALFAFDEVYVDDEHAVVRSRTPGHDQPWIGDFVDCVTELAKAIEAATPAVPPPPAMAGAVPAFRRFAGELGGVFCAGAMRVGGAVVEGARLDLETIFEGEDPARTRIKLALDPPLAKDFDLRRPEVILAAPPAVLELVPVVARLAVAAVARGRTPPPEDEGVPAFPFVGREEIVLELGATLADPDGIRALCAELLALGEALRDGRRAGPYR